MRASRLVAVLLIAAAAGCAHKPPPPPPAPPPPPPPPKGDTLRFKAKPGDGVRNKASVLIEQEVAPPDKRAKPTTVTIKFSFGEEESVDAVAPDGSQLVTARLVDAVGDSPSNQKGADDMALAFDELKIQFKRQARGDVMALGLSGLRKPLDDGTARQVLNALFGAQRGALFPETPVDVGGTWKTSIPIPESLGLAGEVHYDYTYARKEGGVAVIGAEGRWEGTKKSGAVESHAAGKSTTEYRFDVAAGRMISSSVDQMTQVETGDKGSVKQHLRVEWGADKGKAE
jgi:hypothetical protein